MDRIVKEKQRLVPRCQSCDHPCGRNDDYDMTLLWNADEDDRSLKSLILFGIAKSEEEHELPEAEQDEERLAKASVEVTFAVPSKPFGSLAKTPRAVVASVDCTGDTKPAPSRKKFSLPCNKETLKKIGMIAIPTVAVGLVVWSVSANIKHAKRAKRRQQFYRWLG